MPAECVIFVGLPGAGKTTFYHRWFATTHRHVSKDLRPHAKGREQHQQRGLREMLGAGTSVVVDNTNPTRAERAAIVAAAHESGARVVGYFFDVTTREAVARNAGRSGRRRVPNVAIFTAAKRLEPPTLTEGFDQLFHLRLAPDRTFTIEEVV